jgi:hypothetical protein
MTETESQSQPVVCHLRADDIPRRADDWAESQRAMVRHRPRTGGVRVWYRPDAEANLRALADAEAQCCQFLTIVFGKDDEGPWMDLTADTDDGAAVARLLVGAHEPKPDHR